MASSHHSETTQSPLDRRAHEHVQNIQLLKEESAKYELEKRRKELEGFFFMFVSSAGKYVPLTCHKSGHNKRAMYGCQLM